MNHIFSKKQQTGLCIFTLSALLITSCSNPTEESPYQQQEMQSEVLILQKETAKIEQSYPASIEGKVNVDIRPQVSGYIEKIYVDEGAFVKSGQPLFKINESVYREQKNTALASLHAAKSQLVTAQLELDKYEKLAEKKVVSDFQYQKAKAAYESAKAVVGQQQAMVASADLNMGFTVVKAPVSGYVGRIPKRAGNLVSPSDQQALTTLSQVDEIYAYFSIPEAEILNISEAKKGNNILEKLQNFQHIALQLANGSIYGEPGKINMMDGQFDKGTGAVTIRASFLNPQELLRSGNTGRIILTSEQSDVFRIPVLATLEMQDKLFVGVLDKENRVNYLQLQNYSKSGDYYITKTGFNPGDRIVASELGNIPEKTKITLKKAN